MRIIYYPHLFIETETFAKSLLLFYDDVRTISADAVPVEREAAYTLYERVWEDIGSSEHLGFYSANWREQELASFRMRRFLEGQTSSLSFARYRTGVYPGALMGRRAFGKRFHEVPRGTSYMNLYRPKLENELAEYMIDHGWAVPVGVDELQCTEPVARAYMSFLADAIRDVPGTQLTTDQPRWALIANREDLRPEDDYPDIRYLAAVHVPNLVAQNNAIRSLSFRQVVQIREDIQVHLLRYYQDVEQMHAQIQQLAARGRRVDAWQAYEQYCDRIEATLNPLLKDTVLGRFFQGASSLAFFAASEMIGAMFPGSYLARYTVGKGLSVAEQRFPRVVTRLRSRAEPIHSLRGIRNRYEWQHLLNRVPTLIRRRERMNNTAL